MLYRCQGNFPPSPPEWWTTRALEAVQIARCLCVAWRLRSWRIRCWGNPQELSNAERSHKYIYIIFRSIKAWKSRGRAREHKRPWTPTVFGCIMLRICWFFGWNGELNYIYIKFTSSNMFKPELFCFPFWSLSRNMTNFRFDHRLTRSSLWSQSATRHSAVECTVIKVTSPWKNGAVGSSWNHANIYATAYYFISSMHANAYVYQFHWNSKTVS